MSANPRKGPSGRKITLTAPTGGWSSGDLVTILAGNTGWVGEGIADVSAGEEGAVEVGHQATIPKNTGTGEAFTVGAIVYKDASTGAATPNATGNDYLGRATEIAGTSATTVNVVFAPTGA
ncbi:MAG: DUF2190 family protein [Phycisphaerales bacterium JB063]